MKKSPHQSVRPRLPGQLRAMAISMVLIALLAGCASQSGSAREPVSQPTPSNPQPGVSAAEAASEQSQQLSEDEKLLLADDLLESDDWGEGDEDMVSVADPLEPYNRLVFQVNDRLYFWVLKPLATGYRDAVPATARLGIKNFFTNITMPIRLVNSLLQGKVEAAEAELARFVYNSTVGVLGFGNPARKYPALSPNQEDLGQTLANYGLGNGIYIVWPLLGPSTLRDSAGTFGDFFLDPVFFLEPGPSWSLTAFNYFNNVSFRLGDYETLKKAALDPYQSARNGYLQLRQALIRE